MEVMVMLRAQMEVACEAVEVEVVVWEGVEGEMRYL